MPPRRSTRSSASTTANISTAAPISNGATRSRRSAAAKAAPSPSVDPEPVEDEAASDDETEQPDPKPRSKGPAKGAKPTRASGSRGKRSSEAAFGDEEVDEEPAPKKGKAAAAATQNGRGKGRQSQKKTSVAPAEVEEEEQGAGSEAEGGSDDEDAETAKGPRKVNGKAAAKPNGRAKRTVVESSDEEHSEVAVKAEPVEASLEKAADDSSDEDDGPQPKGRGRKTKSSAPSLPTKGKRGAKPQVDDDEDSDDIDATPVKREPRPSVSVSKKVVDITSDDDDEEEDLLAATAAGSPARTVMTATSMREKRAAPAPPPEPTGLKSRLVIHKMALINFKSYAGRQEIGPFHKSFSSIVGPNGSGKSNTIDALLFVFGYRASKMRQGKLSELIHNSADYPDLDFCAVEVHFREIIDLPGPDAFEIVPNTDLVVARKAFKSNTSTYTINDRGSNFTEVTTLLKGRGIDLDHKRFLILQGEVESIAQMKPKAPTEHEDGLLEYLEDIIGTAKYKSAIEESLAEVDKLNEERAEKLNRLRIVEREKSSLEEKKKEAEAYLRDQNELTRAQALLWQYYMWQLRANMEITGKNIALVEKRLADETERHQEQIKDCEELQGAYDEQLKAFQIVKSETEKLVKDLNKHEKEEVQLQEKKKHLNAKAKKLSKSLADDKAAKSAADALIEDKGEEIERARKEVEDQEKALTKEESELENIVESLRDKTEVFNAQIQAKQKELEPWMTQVRKVQSDIAVATNEKKLLEEKAASVGKGVEQAVAAVETLKEELGAKEEEMDSLKKEKDGLIEEANTGRTKLKTLQDKAGKLKDNAKTLREKSDEAKASLNANRSEDAVLSSLTKLKDMGRIKGFHGRLGSLGTIPEKYDVAVSTACGALNNLVVDTVEQGQACIDYLRKHNIGRASIIVLEKLPARDLSKIDTPENVPRLFDLIKPKDPRFAPAFYKGVFNTLVANDLEQANRIAYGQKRWRVVTLAGQLIDTSGTMSGGGTRVQKGGMSAKLAADRVEPEVVARYEKETADAEETSAKLLAELRSFEVQIDAVEKKIPKVEMAISKVELDVKTLKARLTEAEKRASDLKSQSKPDANDAKRVKTLESEITAHSKELEKIKKKSDAIEGDIRDLQEKILEVGGVRLRSQQSKVDGIKQMIDLANERMNKAEVTQAKAEKDTDKYAHSIETHSRQLEELEGELETIEAERATCAADLTTIRENVAQAQAMLDTAKDQLEEMKTDLDEKTAFINQFRALEMELKQKLDESARSLEDSQKKLDHWQARHDELKLEYIDDDEDEEESTVNETKGDEDAQKSETEDVDSQADEDEEPAAPKPKPKRTNPHEIPIYSDDELQDVNRDEVIGQVTLLEERVQDPPNLNVLVEYRKREANFLERAQDLERVTDLRDAEKRRHDDLRKTRLEEFMAGFSTITSKLKEMYQMITLGGNAELELVDSMDPFSEGINFSVMPPKKSWKNISNLSGGEKTLSSLALVFALHVFKPTPLYFMDEIDAALDFRNVSIIANYIKDRTKNAQFIIISLRNDMFELSHRLIGIYKTGNTTKSISINNHALTAITAVAG